MHDTASVRPICQSDGLVKMNFRWADPVNAGVDYCNALYGKAGLQSVRQPLKRPYSSFDWCACFLALRIHMSEQARSALMQYSGYVTLLRSSEGISVKVGRYDFG